MTDSTMPRPDTGVYKRSDSRLWQWQIKTPKDLQALYKSVWAHRCSLGTDDLSQANRKAAALRAEWLEKFEAQRREQSPTRINALTPELARLIANKALHDTLRADQQLRVDPTAQAPLLRYLAGAEGITAAPTRQALDGMPDALADYLTDLHLDHAKTASLDLARGRLRRAIPGMQQVAVSLGILFDEHTPGIEEGLRIYLEMMRSATEALVRRDQGDIINAPPLQPLNLGAPITTPTRYLRDVLIRWKAGTQTGKDSLRRAEHMVDLFEQQTGNPPLDALTRDHGEAVRAHILNLPFASKTKHDRFTTLKSLLNYACNDLGWMAKSPWSGLDIKYRTENKRSPWSDSQLAALFGLPLFQEYALPLSTWRCGQDAAYWIPLLGLYTGARIGELCQLACADVKETEGDRPVISIHAGSEGSTVKTDAGIRTVPVHSELVRLGFLEYVRVTKAAGNAKLWPHLKGRNGKPSGHFSNWFGQFRKQAHIEAPDFHSFRHTVRSKMTEAGVLEAVQDRITGHESNGSVGTTVYTHFAVSLLQTAIEKIKYPGLLLPKVYGKR